MSIKFLSVTLLLSTMAIAAAAQDATYAQDTAAVKEVKTVRISLSESKRNLQSVSGQPLGKIQVVQYLWDSTHIGYAQKGMMNSMVVAIPELDATSWMQTHVNNAYGHLYQPGGIQVLMVVEALRIAEKTGAMSEKAYIHFKGTTYGSADGENYKELATVNIVKSNGGMDVTHKHKSNIANAIQELVDASVAGLGNLASSSSPALSRQGILAIYEAKRNVPALKDSLKEGVYLTFADFKNNQPTATDFEFKKEKRKVFVADKSGNHIECWGAVKAGVVFKNVGYTVMPLSKNQDGYILTKYLDNAKKRNSAIIWSAFGGGAASAVVAGTVQLIVADAFPDLNPQPAGTAIDMETGALIF
ncbi:hypothetical protein [Chitinophaga sp. Cy-1792]|uniref:hypothetical protein n=1 Tax=Chitinophaga sp. Cy-1792 TaxID=2608339 RepID=UPI00141DFC01|nr:hypothetical protein [Chitinophaga sp. Cy-1792]NIG52420.1 hypothetical protein [Chitinophaga sp. Cy-1792]